MRKTITAVTEALIFLLVSFSLYYVVGLSPFYAAWDMDLITAMDLMEIQEGNLPLHIHHTGFGLYFTSHLLLAFARVQNFLSVTSYGDLLDSWNPLFTVAEFTTWFKFLNPIIILGIFAFSWLSVRSYARMKGGAVSTLWLLAIVTTASLWNFHIHLIRSELYAILFFSIGFYLTSQSKLSTHRSLFAFALLIGFAFLTKYQGFFIYVFLILLASWVEAPTELLLRRSTKWALLLSFFFITILSRLTYLSGHFATFAQFYRPNLFSTVVTAILALGLYLKPSRFVFNFTTPPFLVPLVDRWIVIVSGLFFVFFFSFLLVPDLTSGLEYFLFLWRMIFLKVAKDYSYANPHPDTLSKLIWTFKYYSLYLLAVALPIWKCKKNFKLLLLALVAFGSLIFAHRGSSQDALWNEFLLLWLVIYLLRDSETRISVICALLILVNNISNFEKTGLLHNNPVGPYNLRRFLREPYENPYMGYTELFRDWPEALRAKSLQESKNHHRLRQDLAVLWQSPEVKLNRANIIETYARIGERTRIKDYSPGLRGKIISGISLERQISLRIPHGQSFYLASVTRPESVANCALKETELFIKTSTPETLKVYEIIPGPLPLYRGLVECEFNTPQPAAFYAIQ